MVNKIQTNYDPRRHTAAAVSALIWHGITKVGKVRSALARFELDGFEIGQQGHLLGNTALYEIIAVRVDPTPVVAL